MSTRSLNNQRGTAAVEFLIALPFLLVLLLVVSEFGRALFQYNMLTKSARDAARYLSKNVVIGSTGSMLIEASDISEAKNLVVYGNRLGTGSALLPGLTTADISISCVGGGTTCPGVQYMQIDTRYNYQPMLGSSLPTFGLTGSDISLAFTFNSSIIMRAL